MGSSSIANIYIRGLDGNIGPTGFTGNTGNIGNTGNTGNTGPVGTYYTDYSLSGNTLTIFLSNGTTFEVYGTFRGSTTIDKTPGAATGSNTGGQVGILYSVGGGTFNFKGISAYGSLRASYTGPNNEYISIDSIYFGSNIVGNFDPTTFSPRELAYLGTKTLVYGANLTYRPDQGIDGVCGAFDFAFSTSPGSSSDTSSHLNSSSKIYTVGPIKPNSFSGITTTNILTNGSGTTLGILLDANVAGTFVCRTPIGINGITGSFKKNEIASISLLIDSDNVWKFPSNIYFEPDENYLSCGKNLIGLLSYDGGESWIASTSHRGHAISNPNYECVPGYLFGSCCYTNADGTFSCKDYSTRTECNNLFGTFHPVKTCQESCGLGESVCCANGKCIEGVSVTECEAYGGSFWSGYTCGFAGGTFNYPTGDLTTIQIREQGRFCYDPCVSNSTVCCKDGKCLGNYTRVQCELILGGRSLTAATCSEANCCDYNANLKGACCKCITSGSEITSECTFRTYTDCNSIGGFFMGPGKQCADVSCGCVCGDTSPVELGACCHPTISCDITTESVCASRNGVWHNGQNCESACVSSSLTGICCKNGSCTPATSQAECNQQCGNWVSRINVQDSRCLNKFNCPGNKFTYEFGDPSKRDSECQICSMSRPLISYPCKASGEFFGARHDFDKRSCTNLLRRSTDGEIIRIDLLFNENNHYYVIPGVNSNNLLEKIKEAFNADSCPDGETAECLPNKAYIQTMYSYIAFLYSNSDVSQDEANVNWNAWINGSLLNGEESECVWTKPTCCRCNAETSKLDCSSDPEADTIVTFGVDTRIYRINHVGPGSADGNCQSGSECGGTTGQPCEPEDCSPPEPCTTLGGGTWTGQGNCLEDQDFTVPYWSWAGYNDDWQFQNHASDTANVCCGSSSSLKNAKININNQEIHLPLLCDDGCEEFDTVG